MRFLLICIAVLFVQQAHAQDDQFGVQVIDVISPSLPESDPGYATDGSFTIEVTDGASCAGTYTVNASPDANSSPLGNTPSFTTVTTYIGFGEGTFLFANAGVGTYTVTVTETSECDPPESPVVITAEIPGINQATVTVTKSFSDMNPAVVSVSLVCDSGTITPDADEDAGNGTTAIFTVTGFEDGDQCTATETTDLVGYTADESACANLDLTSGADTPCTITNQQDPVTILASKAYADGGPTATFAAACDDATVTVVKNEAAPGSPAEYTISNFPWDGTSCNVTEPVPPSGYSVVGSTCDGISILPNSDAPRTCEITNASSRATFRVTKYFADGNDVDEVEVAIDCNTGLILDQDKDLGDGESVEFVVTSFTAGALSCTITEVGQAGYAAEYNNISAAVINDESCEYLEIAGGEAFECEITNTPLPVEVTVTKEWIFESSSASDIDTRYTLTLYCDAEIEDGFQFGKAFNVDSPALIVQPVCGLFFPDNVQGTEAYADWCKVFPGDGAGMFTARVIPEFPGSNCYWVESGQDPTVEVDQSDCASLTISAGSGAACTITNTVFFEGIPTLSQYGMALLALLMLGVGLVSFRRFT